MEEKVEVITNPEELLALKGGIEDDGKGDE